jgi:hypothetical protein
MPRTYLVFGDIQSKLDVLRVECTKCDRKGRYHVHKLIEKYGRTGNMMQKCSTATARSAIELKRAAVNAGGGRSRTNGMTTAGNKTGFHGCPYLLCREPY